MKLISVSIMDKIPRLAVDSLHYALNLHRGDVIPLTVHAISKSATIFIDVYKASDYLSASSTKRVAPVLEIYLILRFHNRRIPFGFGGSVAFSFKLILVFAAYDSWI